MNLIIRGRAYADGTVKDRVIRVRDGLIAAIADPGDEQPEGGIALGPRQILLPSAIDLQCALRDWGEAERETVETGTKAALAGGVTLVCDQSNTVPRINSSELVRRRAEHVAQHSYADFGIAAHPPTDPGELESYRSAGAFSVQFWPWDLLPWRHPRETDNSRRLFKRCADNGLLGMAMADELAFQGTQLEAQGEAYALEALLRRLDPSFRVRISLTLPQSVDRLLERREQLPNAWSSAPHHALFADRISAYERIGSAAFHVPPLRSPEDVAQLREYALQGKIQLIASFHAPHRTPDKFSAEPIPGEFTPKAGYSAVEIVYPHLLTRLGIEAACRCLCEMPAKFLGLNCGEIAIDKEANLAIVDEDEGHAEQNIHLAGSAGKGIWKIDPAQFHSKAKITPFVGERLGFRVAKTFIRGAEAFDRASDRFTRVEIQSV